MGCFGLVVASEGAGVEGGWLDGVEGVDLDPGVAPALGVAAMGEDVPAAAGADRAAPEAVEAALAGAGLAPVEHPVLDLGAGQVFGELEDLEMSVAAERLGFGRVEHLDTAGDSPVAFDDPAIPPKVAVGLDVALTEAIVHPGAAGREPLLGRGVGGKRWASYAAVHGDEPGDVIGGGGTQDEELATPVKVTALEGRCFTQMMPLMPLPVWGP